MKRKFTQLATVLLGFILFTSCATIVGGSNYNAHVEVFNRPHAKIVYNGKTMGTGRATFPIKRSEANKVAFTVKEDGYENQTINYTSRTLRGWSIVGTLVTWTITVNSIPVFPAGLIVDIATGAIWKPSVTEKGIFKQDYKNFTYILGEEPIRKNRPTVDLTALEDVLYLKDGLIVRGVIIEQEPNVQIRIRIKDGTVLVYKLDEIEKMTREEPED